MTRRDRLLLLVVTGSAAALRFWGIQFGLPHDFARPDEEKLIGPALHILQGDPNPHFFLYPTLFIYAMSAADAVVFGFERLAGLTASRASFAAQSIADPSILHLTARVLAAAAGVATIPVLYSAVRHISSARAALVASVFLAVAFLHVRDSHFGVTDVPATFLIVCAFRAAALCATRGANPPRVAIAGLWSGFAAATKYNAALAALPAAVIIVSRARTRASLPRSAGLLAVLFVCLAAAFLVGTPFALLDWRAFLTEFTIQSRTALGTHHGSILDAARAVVGEHGWSHHLAFTLRYGLGLPLLSAGLAGACWLMVERPSIAAIVLPFPVVFYAAMGVSLLVYARWMVPMVPFLCMTAGMLVDRLAEVAHDAFNEPRLAPVCTAVLVGVLGAGTLARSVAFDRLMTRTDTRVLAAHWIESHFPAGATLYQTGAVYGYVQPHPSDRYRFIGFDERRHRFQDGSRPATALPDLVVVAESPLVVFSHVPGDLTGILDAEYKWVETFKGTITARISNAVYDQQDAFYVPFANLDAIRRPGPDIRLFERQHERTSRSNAEARPSLKGTSMSFGPAGAKDAKKDSNSQRPWRPLRSKVALVTRTRS
jgi:Dolichyl-phosphate-mannose-protein mannosyltransferase